MGCIAARPSVDALTEQLREQFNILRVDIHTEFGQALSERYHFRFTPEFIVFDASGQEVWRGHLLPLDDDLALATAEPISQNGS